MATRKAASKRTAKYGPAAKKSVGSALHRAKKGSLKSGAGHHPKVTSRKQAIAIGLSEARKKGAKVPPPKSKKAARAKSTTRQGGANKRSAGRAKAKKAA